MDACQSSTIPDTQISLVFSNRKTAYGLTRAAEALPPIPTDCLSLQSYQKAQPDASRVDYDLEVARRILSHNEKIDLIVLAGWMHVLSEEFLDVFSGARPYDSKSKKTISTPIPIINLHPALPGAFDGSRAIERAFEAFKKGEIQKTGVMVHRVIKEVDRGEPIIVQEVEITAEDDLARLEQRIHGVEHQVIKEAVKKVLSLPSVW
jgi:phosphoribosylglycinamide formyltransferase